jgi:hypothetical protein
VSHFGRCFIKHFGQAPTLFRKPSCELGMKVGPPSAGWVNARRRQLRPATLANSLAVSVQHQAQVMMNL